MIFYSFYTPYLSDNANNFFVYKFNDLNIKQHALTECEREREHTGKKWNDESHNKLY